MKVLRERKIDLTQGSIPRQLMRFFLPIWCGIFFQQVYVTADAIIISKVVGEHALAAVGCTTIFINLLIGFFTGIGSGAMITIAQFFGARDYRTVRKASHTALCLAVVIGLAVMLIVQVFCAQILHILHTPSDIFHLSEQYLHIYFMGLVPCVLYNMGSGILRAVGDTRRPVYILVGTVFVNIALDLFFTAGLSMGVRGAALATVLSQILACTLILVCMYREKELPVQLRFRELKPDRQMLMHIMRIGLPTGVQSTMFDLSNLLVQASVNVFGTIVVAGWTAYSNIDMVFWMTLTAMGSTISTFVGQNFGAGKMDRLHRGVHVSLLMCAFGSAVFTALAITMRYPLTHLFVTDKETVAVCIRMIFIMMPFYITYIYVEVYAAVIRGVGEALVPMIITALSVCVFRVVWLLWILPLYHTMDMICISYPISWILGSAAFIIYYRKGNWLKKHLPENYDEQYL